MNHPSNISNAFSICLVYLAATVLDNGANVFCFLWSLPLLPPATTAVFGSYLSSLYS